MSKVQFRIKDQMNSQYDIVGGSIREVKDQLKGWAAAYADVDNEIAIHKERVMEDGSIQPRGVIEYLRVGHPDESGCF